jgi:hypothetical protein
MNGRQNGHRAAAIDSRMLQRAQKQSERGTTLLPVALGVARANMRFMRRLIAASNRPPKTDRPDHE